jgi:hypothetical protein
VPQATGPWVKDLDVAKYILLASERLTGCQKHPCYKNRCQHNAEDGAGPINEIDAAEVFRAAAQLLKEYEE